MNGRYFQDRMATGSLPLLVAVVLATAFWWLLPGLAPDGADWGSGVAGGWPSYARRLAAYVLQAGVLCLLAWLTVRHALIRVTATCHLTLYALLAACLLPHTLQAGGVVGCCLLAMLLSLFHTYQHVDPVGLVCQGFFFFGLGTLAFPPMLLLLPFLLVMQAWFHNVTWRTFFAALIGAALPYWLMLGYACAVGDMEVFYAPLRAAVICKMNGGSIKAEEAGDAVTTSGLCRSRKVLCAGRAFRYPFWDWKIPIGFFRDRPAVQRVRQKKRRQA